MSQSWMCFRHKDSNVHERLKIPPDVPDRVWFTPNLVFLDSVSSVNCLQTVELHFSNQACLIKFNHESYTTFNNYLLKI